MARSKSAHADKMDEVIKKLRQDREWTLDRMGKELGVSRDTVNRWETPKGERPPVGDLPFIAQKMGISVQELVTGVPPENINACDATGLSSSVIDTLREKKESHGIFIRSVIERMLSDENLSAFTFDYIGMILSRSDEYDYAETVNEHTEAEVFYQRFHTAGAKQAMIERFSQIIDESCSSFFDFATSEDRKKQVSLIDKQLITVAADLLRAHEDLTVKKEAKRNAKKSSNAKC